MVSPPPTVNPNPKSSRLEAKQEIQQAWHERRARRASLNGGSTTTSTTSTKLSANASTHNSKQQAQAPRRNASFHLPTLCALVQKTWGSLDQHHHQRSNGGGTTTTPTPTTPRGSLSSSKKAKDKTRPEIFPSVLAILQASALVQQVQSLNNNRSSNFNGSFSSNGNGNNNNNNNHNPNYYSNNDNEEEDLIQTKVLSVLPNHYDWNQAVQQMATARSRAFLVVDLTALVRKIVHWQRIYPNIHLCHSVQDNADARLLQVLVQSNIHLVTTSKDDIVQSLQALQTQGRRSKSKIVDSAIGISPSDAYVRMLVLDAHVRVLAIDHGIDAVRLVDTVQRLAQRRGLNQTISLGFLVRLGPTIDQWQHQVQETVQVIQQLNKNNSNNNNDNDSMEQPLYHLAGVSLDIGTPVDYQQRQDAVQQIVQTYSDVTDSLLRVDLTGFNDTFPSEWVTWWNTTKTVPAANITVDCSHPLIGTAAALCTRIIGVRETTTTKTTSSDDATNPTTTNTVHRHYYIDDGCYGSLYQNNGKPPLPLLPLADPSQVSSPTTAATTATTTTYLSTVWGPTCDGLDRVCRDIPLPLLQRDDWLVFPNLGCSRQGLGTAFNGFDPPDTVYCVLGYFPK